MIKVNLIDQAGILSEEDFKRLENFVIDHCLCGTDDIGRLKHIKIIDDGDKGYTGY